MKPSVTDLETTALRLLGYMFTGGTIVCQMCNASDVTDDEHRAGCPALPIVAAVRELARRAEGNESFDNFMRDITDIEGANARAVAAEAERDRLREELEWVGEDLEWVGALNKANIELARRYRDALEQIERDKTHAISIARAALATPDTPPDA
jgi:hypothetical protein